MFNVLSGGVVFFCPAECGTKKTPRAPIIIRRVGMSDVEGMVKFKGRGRLAGGASQHSPEMVE